MHPLDQILKTRRREAAGSLFSRTRDTGTAFEDLCAAFLTHDPVQSAEFRNVRACADWSRDRGLRATDAGIDARRRGLRRTRVLCRDPVQVPEDTGQCVLLIIRTRPEATAMFIGAFDPHYPVCLPGRAG